MTESPKPLKDMSLDELRDLIDRGPEILLLTTRNGRPARFRTDQVSAIYMDASPEWQGGDDEWHSTCAYVSAGGAVVAVREPFDEILGALGWP